MNNNTYQRKKKTGIYKITNIANGKCYIGQSVDLVQRMGDHRRELRRGVHINEYLQRSYNKYEAKNFSIDVIEECGIDELDDKEIFWIRFFESTNVNYGYNMESGGNLNKKHSEVTVKKMSVSGRGKNSILTKKEVVEIKGMLVEGCGQGELAETFGVHYSTISKIANLDNWSYVSPHLNEELKNLKNRAAEKMKFLHKLGWNNVQISRHLNVTEKTVSSHVESNYVKRYKEIARVCRQDFANDTPVEETLKKLGISRSTYSKHTKEQRHKREAELHYKILEMHELGYMNIEIAEKLGVHRTTVTQHIKGRVGPKRMITTN